MLEWAEDAGHDVDALRQKAGVGHGDGGELPGRKRKLDMGDEDDGEDEDPHLASAPLHDALSRPPSPAPSIPPPVAPPIRLPASRLASAEPYPRPIPPPEQRRSMRAGR